MKNCDSNIDENAKFCENCDKALLDKDNGETTQENLEGLKGWLILVGFGIVASTIKLITDLYNIYIPVFNDGTWEALTSPDSELYNSAFSNLLVSEIIFNLFWLLASIYLLYLYFTKKAFFPKLYIWLVVLSLIFIPLDAILASSIFPDLEAFDKETLKEITKSVISALVWIPYMLISKRVKATFVK